MTEFLGSLEGVSSEERVLGITAFNKPPRSLNHIIAIG